MQGQKQLVAVDYYHPPFLFSSKIHCLQNVLIVIGSMDPKVCIGIIFMPQLAENLNMYCFKSKKKRSAANLITCHCLIIILFDNYPAFKRFQQPL